LAQLSLIVLQGGDIKFFYLRKSIGANKRGDIANTQARSNLFRTIYFSNDATAQISYFNLILKN